jgi:hypothetical protein
MKMMKRMVAGSKSPLQTRKEEMTEKVHNTKEEMGEEMPPKKAKAKGKKRPPKNLAELKAMAKAFGKK